MLRMLYVLTCSDLRSVSEESWNDWRASLLAQLYEKTMDVLLGRSDKVRRREPSCLAVTQAVMQYVSSRPSESEEGGLADITTDVVEDFLQNMPLRYRVSTAPQDVARQIRMARRLSDTEAIVWELEVAEDRNYSVLHCVAKDSPGLFCNLCGSLATRGCSILSAQIFTGKTGLCIDTFQIQGNDSAPMRDAGALVRLRTKLNQVLRGEREPKWNEQLPRNKGRLMSSARLGLRPPSVSVSNENITDDYSVLEIKAPDRSGLLYDITSVLDRHRLNVHIALIATEAHQIVDVFYITDLENNRLEPGPRTDELCRELLAAVTPQESTVFHQTPSSDSVASMPEE